MPAESSAAAASPRKTPRKTPWYIPTPAKYLLFVLLMQAFLIASATFRWFEFNQHKGHSVLITIERTALLLFLMAGWLLVSLFFKARPQFSLATLMLLVLVIAIPTGWMAREYQESKQQQMLADEAIGSGFEIRRETASLMALYELPYQVEEFLLESLGEYFFADVTEITILQVAGDQYLEKIEGFPRLKKAVFLQTEFTDSGMARLAKHTHLTELAIYQVPENWGAPRLTDAAFDPLARLTELRVLHLNETGLTDQGVEKLLKLSNLEFVSVTGAEMTDQGLERLQSFSRLQFLELQRTKVTRDGIERFKAAKPNCIVME
jgi:hypothetical protein